MARVREDVVISRTGEVRYAAQVLPDATLAERFAALKELAGPGDLARYLGLECNCCAARVQVDWNDPQLPPGWTATADGEFCGPCRGGAAEERRRSG